MRNGKTPEQQIREMEEKMLDIVISHRLVDDQAFVRSILGMMERRRQMADWVRSQTGHAGLLAEAEMRRREAVDEAELRQLYALVFRAGMQRGRDSFLEEMRDMVLEASAPTPKRKPKKRSPPKKKRRASRT